MPSNDCEEDLLATLTPSETQIFELIGEGLSNRQIADRMYLAEKTIKNYISKLFRKLGVSRRAQAAALAARVDERRKRSDVEEQQLGIAG